MSTKISEAGATVPLAPPRYAPPHMLVSLVERERLLDQLERARARKVTLLRAPGGYGKTSLLLQWWERLGADDTARIWVSLGAQYSEPDTFVAGLIQAANQAGFDLALPENQGPLAGNAAKLAQRFADALAQHEDEIVIFLDDYHLVRNERVDNLLDQIVRDCGPHVHFAIAARRTPGISVQTLRIEGQLTELGYNELSFTGDETQAFFGGRVNGDALATLARKTEGWPAALQMINLGLAQGQDIDQMLEEFSGQNQEVAAYLAEKVLRSLPKEKVDFLVRTSILSLVNGDVADFICERTDGWAMLDSLDELGAFLIPVTAERHWYRYHDLFAEFLQSRLQLLGRPEVRRLHERASLWYEGQGQTINAAHHALAGGDLDRVERLIEAADTGSFWVMDQFGDYIELVRRLPESVTGRMPRLRAIEAMQLIKSGAMEAGRTQLEIVRKQLAAGAKDDLGTAKLALDLKLVEAVLEAYLDEPIDTGLVADLENAISEHSGETLATGAIYNALTLLYHRLGEHGKAMDAARSALDRYLESGSRYGAIFMHLHTGMFELLGGRLDDALASYQHAGALFERYSGDDDLAALITLFTSEALYERGALAAAQSGLAEVLERTSVGDSWVEALVGGYRSASALAFAQSGLGHANWLLDMAEATAKRRDYPRLAYWARMRRIYLAAVAGDMRAAKKLRAEYDFDDEGGQAEAGFTWRETYKRRLTAARLALADRRYEPARQMLSELRAEVSEHGFRWLALKATLLEAAALAQLDRMDDAAPLVDDVLTWTRTQTMPSIILEEGAIAIDLLEGFIRHTGLGELPPDQFDWIAELIARAPDYQADRASAAEPFSPRELEVIDALRDELPTKRIADELGITDSAVAFHLKNIFKKAGVKNRHLVVPVTEKRRALDEEARLAG